MKIRSRAVLTFVLAVFAAIVVVTPSAIAQSPRAVTLAKPEAELRETFTSITSIRELKDGRVIVSDSRDKVLHIVDLKNQTATALGRIGSGPAEFQSAGSLYALAGDTTLLSDFANSRYLIINPDGKVGATRMFYSGPFTAASPFGMDERGVIHLKVAAVAREEGGLQNVVRFDPTTKRADTVVSISRPKGLMSGARSMGGGMLKMFTNLPFAPEDVVAIGADGRIAVARAESYHLEWYGRDGKKIIGPVVNYAPIEITTAEKRTFMEKQLRPGTITVQNSATGTVAPMSKAPASKVMFSEETYDDKGMTWPARKPPFVAGAMWIDGGGRAWVLRTTANTVTQLHYDVFDANAKLIMSVVLPPRTRLAGFGARSVYLAFSDEDDLQHLQRYPAPL